MLLNIASFVFVLGILIFIHELGHFLVAKRVGIRVDQFSLGFPPHIVKKAFGGTEYCIGIIPLGGYVKMAGEQPNEESTGAPDEFMSKTVGQRAAVIFAGPFMNYVLAIVLLMGIAFFGGRPIVDHNRIIVGEVSDDSPAQKAGLAADDVIIAFDGKPVSSFDSLRVMIAGVVQKPIELTWVQGADTVTKEIVTTFREDPNLDGGIDTVGVIGFGQKVIGTEPVGAYDAVKDGFIQANLLVWYTLKFVKQAVTLEVSPKLIGGPLFIAQESGRQAEKGAANLFFFMALLSVNLAIINVVPIPVLDGGHLLFLTIEKIKGSPLSMRARIVAQQVGIVAILSLVVFVTYNDILRIIRGF